MDKYGDNIIFQTLLNPYLEKQTIKHANIRLYFAIILYLQECCERTLDMCDKISRSALKEEKQEHARQLEIDLQWLIRSLAFKVATKNDELYRSFCLPREDENKGKIYNLSQTNHPSLQR
jgi:hypothetical protein